jgi:tRNA U34 5-carboxymethylaminomethyl modifying GTPase MnmE/TrmE
VSIIANEPGTTRDHVGALINFAGLSAIVIDTPGMRTTSDPAEHAAREEALRIVANADLVLHCIDSADDAARESIQRPAAHNPAQRVIRVMLRSDLGKSHHSEHCDVALGNLDGQSDKTSFGLDVLVARVRETLVPSSAVRDPIAWSFWL